MCAPVCQSRQLRCRRCSLGMRLVYSIYKEIEKISCRFLEEMLSASMISEHHSGFIQGQTCWIHYPLKILVMLNVNLGRFSHFRSFRVQILLLHQVWHMGKGQLVHSLRRVTSDDQDTLISNNGLYLSRQLILMISSSLPHKSPNKSSIN